MLLCFLPRVLFSTFASHFSIPHVWFQFIRSQTLFLKARYAVACKCGLFLTLTSDFQCLLVTAEVHSLSPHQHPFSLPNQRVTHTPPVRNL